MGNYFMGTWYPFFIQEYREIFLTLMIPYHMEHTLVLSIVSCTGSGHVDVWSTIDGCLSFLLMQDLVKAMDREQPTYDSLIQTGQQLRRRAGPEADREGGVGHTIRTLQTQWEAARQKASERKVSYLVLSRFGRSHRVPTVMIGPRFRFVGTGILMKIM